MRGNLQATDAIFCQKFVEGAWRWEEKMDERNIESEPLASLYWIGSMIRRKNR